MWMKCQTKKVADCRMGGKLRSRTRMIMDLRATRTRTNDFSLMTPRNKTSLNLRRWYRYSTRVKINGRYGILNVDLTCGFCCDFEFNCLVLQRGARLRRGA